MKTPFLRTVFAIVRKDLRTELRSRELVSSMALFALLSILIFSFALELDREARESAISGVLWVTVIYASTIGLNRSMAMEREQANLDGMFGYVLEDPRREDMQKNNLLLSIFVFQLVFQISDDVRKKVLMRQLVS